MSFRACSSTRAASARESVISRRSLLRGIATTLDDLARLVFRAGNEAVVLFAQFTRFSTSLLRLESASVYAAFASPRALYRIPQPHLRDEHEDEERDDRPDDQAGIDTTSIGAIRVRSDQYADGSHSDACPGNRRSGDLRYLLDSGRTLMTWRTWRYLHQGRRDKIESESVRCFRLTAGTFHRGAATFNARPARRNESSAIQRPIGLPMLPMLREFFHHQPS